MTSVPDAALQGVRVVDAATVYAGPMIATLLGDFGADVVKVEHPRGDALRDWAWSKEGESLWWAVVGRNKRSVSLKLSDELGAEALRRLVVDADVLVESFRPGTLERWGLNPQDLLTRNPRLVIVRVSGFGQTGPYRSRPGFGTLAESMSGFAETNGAADGPPVLPQWPLADGVAALAGAFATMVALRHAEATGEGQIVDLSIYEPLFWILGAQTTAYDQLGVTSSRQGSRTPFNVPRDCFRARDGRWVALSGATTATAARIIRAVGRDDLANADWFGGIQGRLEHREEIDGAITEWIAERDSDAVMDAFNDIGATLAPVYSIVDIAADPHFRERGSIITLDHPRLGPLEMQGLIAQLSGTPGRINTPGPLRGEHSDTILRDELGYTDKEISRMRREGVVGERPPSADASKPDGGT